MPFGDGTGPLGKGSGTGRGLGKCRNGSRKGMRRRDQGSIGQGKGQKLDQLPKNANVENILTDIKKKLFGK